VTEQTGEIFDLGYQHYQGPREGRMRARQALLVNGVRTAIGLGRGWQSKVLPGLLFLAVVIPAVVISLTASAAEPFEAIPGHADYYRIVSVILFLFSATIAPELLCPDRRDRVIDLYLVRPLTTTDYVVGRYLAFFSVMLALVLFGQIILFLGLTLAAEEPLEYIPDNWLDIPRFFVAGIVVALFATTIPLAVSTFTIRRTYAAAIVIALFLVSLPVAAILSLCDESEAQSSALGATQQRCEPATGDAAKWFALLSFPEVPMHVSDIVFDDESDSDFAELVRELPTVIPIGWFLILTIGPGFVLWWQYRRMVI
jgi:ABC-2 type transport system permease protein